MSDTQLISACRAFVSFKERLDESLTEVDDPYERFYERRAIFPKKFLRDALPFSDAFYSYDDMVPETIDPTLVISGQYRDRPDQGRDYDHEIMEWSDGIVSDNDKYCSEAPRYARIGTMPLYVALEGKNRVTLFKRHQRPMRAFITPVAFPAPSDLTIVRFSPFGAYGLAYQDEPARIIPYPEVALPLLTAYGVTSQEKSWSLRAAGYARTAQKEIRKSRMAP